MNSGPVLRAFANNISLSSVFFSCNYRAVLLFENKIIPSSANVVALGFSLSKRSSLAKSLSLMVLELGQILFLQQAADLTYQTLHQVNGHQLIDSPELQGRRTQLALFLRQLHQAQKVLLVSQNHVWHMRKISEQHCLTSDYFRCIFRPLFKTL